MTLSKHVDADKLSSELLSRAKKNTLSLTEQYIFDYDSNSAAPKYQIPEKSSNGDLVLRYVTEGLALDGIPTLNFASFVNTDLDPHAEKLITNNIVKNLADNDEYPSLIECQQRCINILANLWNAPVADDKNAIGTATTGSSEAIMLAGLAMKKTWQEKRKKAGKSIENPNILMASVAQVALEKFARYFDVEDRIIRVTAESNHLIDTTEIKKNIDENTIGIFVIVGSTFTGAFEPVEQISQLLDEVQEETGLDIPIHVDGASGGFIAPFAFPHLKWDFSVPRVVSINTSGHKFGLTTAGLGWVIWREVQYLPETLRFKLDYLGGVEETFGLNFSRPGFPVLHQYYNFLTFGREGYTKKFVSCLANARLLSNFLEGTGYYEVLSVIHRPVSAEEKKKIYTRAHDPKVHHKSKDLDNEDYMPGLPVVAFRFSDKFRQDYPDIPQAMVSLLLRNRQFIIPNYHLTPAEQEKEILRVVVKDNLPLNLLEKLMSAIVETTELLIRSHDAVVGALDSTKVTSDADRKALVYKVLLSITSNGVEDVKDVQRKTLDKPGTGHHKHKRSYRGAC